MLNDDGYIEFDIDAMLEEEQIIIAELNKQAFDSDQRMIESFEQTRIEQKKKKKASSPLPSPNKKRKRKEDKASSPLPPPPSNKKRKQEEEKKASSLSLPPSNKSEEQKDEKVISFEALNNDEYTTLVSSIKKDYNKMMDNLRTKRPMFKTQWQKHVQKYFNPKCTLGLLQKATLFSGGCVFMTNSVYVNSIPAMARDIFAGKIMTVNEIAHNHDGIRVHFELDFRQHSVPTNEQMNCVVKIIHAMLIEMYPKNDRVMMYVANSKSKLKYKKSGEEVIAYGIHVIFPGILVNSHVLKMMSIMLDNRICTRFPSFSGVVDYNSIRSETASLRMIYSHKMDDCPACLVVEREKKRKDHNQRKRRKNDSTSGFYSMTSTSKEHISMVLKLQESLEWNAKSKLALASIGFEGVSENTFDQVADEGIVYNTPDDIVRDTTVTDDMSQIIESCNSCRNGRIIHPYVYIPFACADKHGNRTILKSDTYDDIYKNLMNFSIQPLTLPVGEYHEVKVAPKDFPSSILDQKPAGRVLFKVERSKIKNSKFKTYITAQDHPELYREIGKYIKQLGDGHYAQTRPTTIAYNTKFKTVCVNVTGLGQRYCPLNGGYHNSNRVWFEFVGKMAFIKMSCYDEDCIKKINYVRKHTTNSKGSSSRKRKTKAMRDIERTGKMLQSKLVKGPSLENHASQGKETIYVSPEDILIIKQQMQFTVSKEQRTIFCDLFGIKIGRVKARLSLIRSNSTPQHKKEDTKNKKKVIKKRKRKRLALVAKKETTKDPKKKQKLETKKKTVSGTDLAKKEAKAKKKQKKAQKRKEKLLKLAKMRKELDKQLKNNNK